MGERAAYGFRKNNKDFITQTLSFGEIEDLGRGLVTFCHEFNVDKLQEMCDNIELVDINSEPSKDQIDFCKQYGSYNDTVAERSETSWYCLLRNVQGEMKYFDDCINMHHKAYMIDCADFVLDSMMCEHAYVINLDTGMLEMFIGFQKTPTPGNRYGTTVDRYGYYPCRLIWEYPLDDIPKKSPDEIVEIMKEREEEVVASYPTNNDEDGSLPF